MVRVREGWKKGLPAVAGLVAGALLAPAFTGGTTDVAEAAAQDPQVAMQIQQALNNFQIQLQNRLTMMQTQIDTMEREVRDTRFQLDTGISSRTGSALPTPTDPIPGTSTWGRLVSQQSESQRYVLQGAGGSTLAQLGMTSDGPALLLYDVGGAMSAALVATNGGPELRMVDGDGVLQTVLPARQ